MRFCYKTVIRAFSKKQYRIQYYYNPYQCQRILSAEKYELQKKKKNTSVYIYKVVVKSYGKNRSTIYTINIHRTVINITNF